MVRISSHLYFRHIIQFRFSSTQRPTSIYFGILPPEYNFTGRDDELQDLDNALQRNVNSSNNVESLISVVAGLGGIGKTQLVREYVNRNRSKYDDNVIWIDAEKGELMVCTFKILAKDMLFISTIDANGREKDINSIIQSVYDYFP